MYHPAGVLIYGRDVRLLETRSWMLGKAGYRVSTATEVADVERILRSEEISLSILCHTLSREQREMALTATRGIRPAMKSLLLVTRYRPEVDHEANEVLSTSDGPGALVQTVNRMLG
jgi:hypothetical protein